MTMLVTLNDMKSYLGETTTTYDVFLTQQIKLISDAIENYTGRVFGRATWIQTFYHRDYPGAMRSLMLYHWPINSVSYVKVDGVTMDAGEYRSHLPTGIITREFGFLRSGALDSNMNSIKTEIQFNAGYDYANIPVPIQSAVYDLVQERYNRKKSGVAPLSFGSDVQRVSIPGAISIDFDYTLNNNDRKNAFGLILQAQLNVLDFYRSERAIIGSGQLQYVDTGTADAGVAASLVNQGLTYTAQATGPNGNLINVQIDVSGSAGQALAVITSNKDIRVLLAKTPIVFATLVVQDITYTAKNGGTAGNAVSVEYDNDGVGGAETVNIVGQNVIVHMQDGVSTADQIKAAIDNSAPAQARLTAAISGTGTNTQVAVVQTSLAGGSDGAALTSTADDVKAAVNADATAHALVQVTGSGVIVLSALAATFLAGGE